MRKGKKHTEETKQKMSFAAWGPNLSEETKIRRRLAALIRKAKKVQKECDPPDPTLTNLMQLMEELKKEPLSEDTKLCLHLADRTIDHARDMGNGSLVTTPILHREENQ